jgi:hypothetical protein
LYGKAGRRIDNLRGALLVVTVYRKAIDPGASDGEDMVRVTDGDMSWNDVNEPYYRRAAFCSPSEELE